MSSGQQKPERERVGALMVGSGEYTTGCVHGEGSRSDKASGVVALTLLDLRRRGLVGDLALCGVNGKKFPGIRAHLQRAIGDVYEGLDLTMKTFPSDDEVNPLAYKDALLEYNRGDVATIFTPDDTHFEIAMACIQRGLHVLVTKPIVMTLEHHRLLHEEALKQNVLVAVEVHKRLDPMYADARDRIKNLGNFSYMYSYMSQPKHQLDTFKAWAGKSSDISYYLNSHHIDFHEWCVGETSRPIQVTAQASTDTCNEGQSLGTAVYTSSWVAPKSDVHSQQRFFYMGQKGEINVDQAHRGYTMADDSSGFKSVNPLFMKYTPTNGKFSGQQGYGYRSFENFIDAAIAINNGTETPKSFDQVLATISTTYRTTAVLEAGRRSLDEKRPVTISYDDASDPCRPTGFA